MHRTAIARSACIVALIFAALLVPLVGSLMAQKAAAERKASSPRLPNYYAKVASGQQQTELRAVMQEFAPQIAAKRDELQALIDKRNSALEALLTEEQRQQIAKHRAEAAQRRKAASKAKAKAKTDRAKAKKAA